MPRSHDHKLGVVRCSVPDCKETLPNHAWGKIKADGWFFQKDGTNYCPNHIPNWVRAWRKRKKETP